MLMGIEWLIFLMRLVTMVADDLRGYYLEVGLACNYLLIV